MSFLRRFFLSILSIIFLLFFSFWLIVFNSKVFFFNAQFYEKLLIRTGFYERVLDSTPPIILAQLEKSGNELPFTLSDSEIDSVLTRIVTPQYLQQESEKILEVWFGFLIGQRSNLSYQLSLEEIKINLEKDWRPLLETKVHSLPVCGPEIVWVESEELKKLPTCIPANIDRITFLNKFILEAQVSQIINQIPDNISFMPENEDVPVFLFQLQWLISWVITHGLIILSIVLGGIGLLILVIAQPISAKFRYLATNILVISVGPLLTSLIGFLSQGMIVKSITSWYLVGLDNFILTPLVTWLTLVFREILGVILVPSFVLLCLSIILFAIAKIIANREAVKVETDLVKKLQKEG